MNSYRSAKETWFDRSAEDREAWNNFRRAAGEIISHVDADLQHHLKVGYSDVDTLLQLSTSPSQCLRMATLARAVSRTPSTLTRLVDRLERRALVARKRNSRTDVQVEVTPKGIDVLNQAAPLIVEQVDIWFWSRLTKDERATLSSLCKKLIDEKPECC